MTAGLWFIPKPCLLSGLANPGSEILPKQVNFNSHAPRVRAKSDRQDRSGMRFSPSERLKPGSGPWALSTGTKTIDEKSPRKPEPSRA